MRNLEGQGSSRESPRAPQGVPLGNLGIPEFSRSHGSPGNHGCTFWQEERLCSNMEFQLVVSLTSLLAVAFLWLLPLSWIWKKERLCTNMEF